MGYDIVGANGKTFSCGLGAWPECLGVATAFGWAPEGAFFKHDEGGLGPYRSGSYLYNDWQLVGDDDARALGAALHLAIATVNAGAPMTDDQAKALKAFEVRDGEMFPGVTLTEQQRAGLLKLQEQQLAAHPPEVRPIRIRGGSFDINIRMLMDLAALACDGQFQIS